MEILSMEQIKALNRQELVEYVDLCDNEVARLQESENAAMVTLETSKRQAEELWAKLSSEFGLTSPEEIPAKEAELLQQVEASVKTLRELPPPPEAPEKASGAPANV